MIEIKSLKESDKGRGVVYKDDESGVITTWNDTYIFVRYGSERHSKATYPRDLKWEIGK